MPEIFPDSVREVLTGGTSENKGLQNGKRLLIVSDFPIGSKGRPVIIHDADHQRPLEVAGRIPRDAGQSAEERIPFGKGRNHDSLLNPLYRSRHEGSLRKNPIVLEIFFALSTVHVVSWAIREITLPVSAFSIQ